MLPRGALSNNYNMNLSIYSLLNPTTGPAKPTDLNAAVTSRTIVQARKDQLKNLFTAMTKARRYEERDLGCNCPMEQD